MSSKCRHTSSFTKISPPSPSSKFSNHPTSSMFLSILQSQRLPSSYNDSMQAGTEHIYFYGGVGSWFVVFSSDGTSLCGVMLCQVLNFWTSPKGNALDQNWEINKRHRNASGTVVMNNEPFLTRTAFV